VQAGARSMKDLREQLGVSEDCGCCGSCAKQCLRDARNNLLHTTTTNHNNFYAAA